MILPEMEKETQISDIDKSVLKIRCLRENIYTRASDSFLFRFPASCASASTSAIGLSRFLLLEELQEMPSCINDAKRYDDVYKDILNVHGVFKFLSF